MPALLAIAPYPKAELPETVTLVSLTVPSEALLYRAPPLLPLAELPIQYADYAVWQRERLQGEVLERLSRYWLGQLEGLPHLELPCDHPRPRIRTTHGEVAHGRLSSERASAISELAGQEQATTFMTLLAAFQTLLYRYCGQDDFPVGVPVAATALTSSCCIPVRSRLAKSNPSPLVATRTPSSSR